MVTPIAGPATATLGQVLTVIKNSKPKREAEAIRFARRMHELCGAYGYNFVVPVAQAMVETGRPGVGYTEPFESDHWEKNLGSAGIGVTDGPNRSIPYSDGGQAAEAHFIHLAGYHQGNTGWVAGSALIPLDPQWPYLLLHPQFGQVRYVEQLGSGVWATQDSATYAGNILKAMALLEGADDPAAPDDGTADDPTVPDDAKATMPPIVWRGSDNYHARGMPVLGFVFHITADEHFPNTDNWFQNPNSNASSHVVVDRDGTIYQYVSSKNAAWTNGDRKQPNLAIAYCRHMHNLGVNWNNGCITFEFVATAGSRVTEKQYQSGEALVRYWCHPEIYGKQIKRTRGWFARHSDINAIDKAFDPGPGFDLTRLIRCVGGDPADLS